MRESVVFLSMIQVLAYIFITVELNAAMPWVYRPILSFGDITDGWHRARENHYKFERRVIIGRNHPYDQYSSMKMFWPEERSPHTTRDRITFFKCINQTPSTAKTWMYVIRGGMGSPEVVVDVRYAPVRFMLLNEMIITCHIYTETSNTVTREKHFSWNPFHVQTSNMQREPVTDRTSLLTPSSFPSTSGTIYLEDITSSVDIKPTITTIISNSSENTTGFYNEGISEVTDKSTAQFKKICQKTDQNAVLIPENDEKRGETNISINGLCAKIKGGTPQVKRIRTFNLDTEKANLETGNMTLEVTGDESFHKTLKCPRLGKITLHNEDEVSGMEQIIEILCGGTSSETIGTSRSTLNEYTADDQASETTSDSRITVPSATRTTIQVKNFETVKITSQKWGTSSEMHTASSSMDVLNTQTEELTEITSESISPGTNVIDEHDEHSSTERPIEKMTIPLKYNLMIVNIAPVGLKKKIGLAKITY